MSLEERPLSGSGENVKPLHLGLKPHLRGLLGWGIRRIRSSPDPANDPLDPVSGIQECVPASPVGSPANPSSTLEQQAEKVAVCQQCDLCHSRILTAFGVGDPAADLMFVGGSPDAEEDRSGEPFGGPAGQLLDRIIGALGLSRDRVYITNVLKCHPPENRDPLPQELVACLGHLEAQIARVDPVMIVALGRPAAGWLTGQETSLAKMRGQKHLWRGIPLVATYHPAFLIQQPEYKAHCWQDLQRVIEVLQRTPARPRS
ncbi:MAG: uracil-DNA glycosylase [Planctomycetota bacterium]|nr:uracil-DNA glycosylase [Planctomycetota bacterium]